MFHKININKKIESELIILNTTLKQLSWLHYTKPAYEDKIYFEFIKNKIIFSHFIMSELLFTYLI